MDKQDDINDFIKQSLLRAKTKNRRKNNPPMPIKLTFTKEDIYREFDKVLKENYEHIDKEGLKKLDGCLEIVDLCVNDINWIEVEYKLKYNNTTYGNRVSTSDFKTPKDWAEYFYGKILQNYDPLENDPQTAFFIKKAAKEARRKLFLSNLLSFGKSFGYCHVFWKKQKQILRDKYGIDWKTPAERNPHTRYD